MEYDESFKRFSSDWLNFSSDLLPSDNEETIYNINPPISSSLDLSGSVCSDNSCANVPYRLESESTRHEIESTPFEFGSGSNYNSEPEDMQDYNQQQNKSLVNVDSMNSSFVLEGDKSLNNMVKCDDFIGPFVYTSSPLALRGKNVSLSLQDMSSIETFPLLPKTKNGFSSETIPSQSLSSTTKSKDSGFQRSASCLSLNSGNRTYDHVQSKVKQYIRDIKSSEESRKRLKQMMPSIPKDNVSGPKKTDTPCSSASNNDTELIKTVSVLKNELKEKDSTLNQLQENYNSLLQKYAEAANQIDLLRLRNSMNNSYRSDFTISTEDLVGSCVMNNHPSHSKNVPSSNTLCERSKQSDNVLDYSKSLPKKMSSLNISGDLNRSFDADYSEPSKVRSESFLPLYSSKSSHDLRLPEKFETEVDFCPRSSSSSTVVSSTPRTKTPSLGPISKYYSSSSRLGKKHNAPLPSSKPEKNGCHQQSQHKNNVRMNGHVLNTGDNDKVSSLRSNQIHHISKVHPFERVYSYLEKVHPFKKIWQDSLPTKNLIESHHSSSSEDSTKLIDGCKKLDKHCSTQSKPNRYEIARRTNRSKSEQNLFSNPTEYSLKAGKGSASSSFQNKSKRNDNIDRVYDSFREKNVRTDAFDLTNTEKVGKKCSRNILASSNAFDRNISPDMNFSDDDIDNFGHNIDRVYDSFREKNVRTDAFELTNTEKVGKKCSRNILASSNAFDRNISPDMNFSDDDIDNFGQVDLESKGKHVADDSSSISSSIFSLPKDDVCSSSFKKDCNRPATNSDWKTPSHFKNGKSTSWEKRKSSQSISLSPKRKKSDRVCFSPKNRRVPERKNTGKTPGQENPKDLDLKVRTSSFNKKTVVRQKLKCYTEILKSTPNRDVGVQVSNSEPVTKETEVLEDTSQLSRLDSLDEASEYLRQMKQGMDRLCDYIENLKVDSKYLRSDKMEKL